MADAPTTPEEQKLFKPTAMLAAYARIFDLGPDRVAILNAYLLSESHTYEQIINILKTEWKVFVDVKDDTLRRQLIRYKNDYILPKQAEIVARLTNNANVEKLARVTSRLQQNVDALATLEWAINLQTRRVKRQMKKEASKGPDGIVVFTQTKDQTDNLYLLTSQVAALAKLQMDVGILKKVPKKIAFSAEMSEEEAKFAEKAQLHAMESTATAMAIRYMREHKLLTAAEQTVPMESVQSAAPMSQTPSPDVADDIEP